MKFFLVIPILLMVFFASAQPPKVIKVGSPKILVSDPKVKVADKKTSTGSGTATNSGTLGSKQMSKNYTGKVKFPRALGILGASTFHKKLADGTTMTTSLFIKNSQYAPQTSRTLGEPKTYIKPKSKKNENGNGWDCSVEQIKVSLDDESFMNASNEQQSSNLYPGAIYAFDNFFNGAFKPEKAPRRPFRITTSASGIQGNVFEIVETPDAANIKNAVNKLFNRMPNSNAISGYRSKIYECNSLAEQMIKLTGGGGAYGFSASFGMEMNNKSQYRNFVIDCTQEMYSISSEMPDSGFFVNPADGGKDGLMVMSNVTYGQRVLVSLTTKMVSNEFGSKFDAAYSGFGASAKIGLDALTKDASEETTVKIYIVGGTNPGLIETTKDQLKNKLNEYFRNANVKNAKPISYQFKNMNDEVVQSQSATDYFPVRKCIPSPPPGVNASDIKWRITIELNNITNETDMQESIHLGIHQMATVKGIAKPVMYEGFNNKNMQGHLIAWGGYPLPTMPYEEPRTFKRSTNPSKKLSFIISQQDADDGAYLQLLSNYIAMVSTRIGGKTNESSRAYEQKFALKELMQNTVQNKTFSINFNNRVFKFDYILKAQKL